MMDSERERLMILMITGSKMSRLSFSNPGGIGFYSHDLDANLIVSFCTSISVAGAKVVNSD